MGKASSKIISQTVHITLNLSELYLWEIGCGRLYYLELSLCEKGKTVDFLKSCFGVREICLDDKCMRLNGKVFFGRLMA